jgi:hypothetical protein
VEAGQVPLYFLRTPLHHFREAMQKKSNIEVNKRHANNSHEVQTHILHVSSVVRYHCAKESSDD